MSWHELATRGLRVVPFEPGRAPRGPESYSQFSASLSKTLRLLARELEMLTARNIVIELDITERMVRLDGYPRADARPSSPAVAVAFESKHGPLTYATREFSTWQDNLRAIALSLEALRSVDRYGVSKRGEQYRGWKALPAGAASDDVGIHDAREAREYLDERYQGDLRAAIRASHPDHGGDADEFRRVMRVRELLG